MIGQQVDFTFVVTNTGGVTLTAVGVTDDTGLVVTSPEDDTRTG
jgi:uncharacterized repeat protein (TIGR01451 family)